MSAYDVDIGKLIRGKRELKGSGSYLLCTTDNNIIESPSYGANDGLPVSAKDVEDALYEFCMSALDEFIAEDNNKDVYTFSIYTDTYHGSYIIYINNLEGLGQTVEDYLERELQRHPDREESHVRQKLNNELKYSEGDCPFMYEELPDRLEEWLNIVYSVSLEDSSQLNIAQNYIFENTFFDSQLFLIAIDVIHRLQPELERLDRTDDFIAYVSAADGVGGDYLTTSQLLRRCVTEEQLYIAMPDVKEKDQAFEEAVHSVKQKSLHEQVQHWVTAINKGEFGKNSPHRFWKTDYEAYEQLIALGNPAIPYVQAQLNGEIKPSTRTIVEMVLRDLDALT